MGDKELEEREQHLSGEFSELDELKGTLSNNDEEQKLMHTVMESDKDNIDDGKLITDSINQGMGSFTPDMLFESLVKDYRNARRLMGESILRELTGYDPEFIEKNMALPEFRRELKERINQKVQKLKKKGLVDKQGLVTRKGIKLSSLTLYTEELDNLVAKGLGEKVEHKKGEYGDKGDYWRRRHEKYKDIAVRQSLKTSIRRGHKSILPEDLRIFERIKKGKISIIYAMDTSGSMKGGKLERAKKAGIALAYKAIGEKNKVGLVVFDSEVRKAIEPSEDFNQILEELTIARAGLQTDLPQALMKAVEIFGQGKESKHLVMLTDALPTKGEQPEKNTLEAVGALRDNGISLSLVGIDLDERGLSLAKRMTEVGDGRLYHVKDMKELDKIILEDYYST